MLRELRIRNLAIIDDLKVRFEDGFNVLTGETGAGKSIIVDSLGLALGSRAQGESVRSGEKEAVVQAYFEVAKPGGLPDIGIDISDSLILRRTVSASGKSRAYVNDTMVSLQSLAEIGRALVDIHGQHEHQSLLSVEKHRLFLDSFGKLEEDKVLVERLYGEFEILRKEEADLIQQVKERAQRLDLLKFQIREIDTASLKSDEKEGLTEERSILANTGKLRALAESAYSMIYSKDDSCLAALSSILSKIREMAAVDHGASEIMSLLESALPLVEDAAVALRKCRDKYEFEPSRLEAIEDRLELIGKLEKKYGEGIEAILRHRDLAEKEMRELEAADERRESLGKKLKEKEDALYNAGLSLSKKRKYAARRMEKLIRKELRELAFGSAEFIVEVQEEALSRRGMDRVEFLFSANPGEPSKPLAKIASGGEISRVMLALKGILAEFDSIPVLIFDEVDAGIGGKTAESVGKKLKALSNKHQVLCTTHLPQIASMGDFHLKTEKGLKGDRVHVQIRELSGPERLHEIARMMSGKITGVSLQHAKELIEGI